MSERLREQFEAWALQHKPGMWGFENETAWQAYQAGHNESKSHDEFIRGRFADVVPDLCVGSWEEIWERVRDNFKEKK